MYILKETFEIFLLFFFEKFFFYNQLQISPLGQSTLRETCSPKDVDFLLIYRKLSIYTWTPHRTRPKLYDMIQKNCFSTANYVHLEYLLKTTIEFFVSDCFLPLCIYYNHWKLLHADNFKKKIVQTQFLSVFAVQKHNQSDFSIFWVVKKLLSLIFSDKKLESFLKSGIAYKSDKKC